MDYCCGAFVARLERMREDDPEGKLSIRLFLAKLPVETTVRKHVDGNCRIRVPR
jgi:hypothetical protein